MIESIFVWPDSAFNSVLLTKLQKKNRPGKFVISHLSTLTGKCTFVSINQLLNAQTCPASYTTDAVLAFSLQYVQVCAKGSVFAAFGQTGAEWHGAIGCQLQHVRQGYQQMDQPDTSENW